MIKMLVTGSNGFIGRNLVDKAKGYSHYEILEFNRNHSINDLIKMIGTTDIIIHLAGEVKPNSSDKDFKKSNVSLTETIIQAIELNKRYIPILIASTVHAECPKNEYGKTKRESELLIEEYSSKYNVDCLIYRLPHVFGEGCKVNYNSVISTWIYNKIKGLEINVYDNSYKMNYVYVQDIVEQFLDFKNDKDLYINPEIVYETTLGEAVDFIDEFHLNIENNDYLLSSNTFKSKLFKTYQNYYRKFNVK